MYNSINFESQRSSSQSQQEHRHCDKKLARNRSLPLLRQPKQILCYSDFEDESISLRQAMTDGSIVDDHRSAWVSIFIACPLHCDS